MLTNQLNAEINFDNLCRDYDIFKVSLSFNDNEDKKKKEMYCFSYMSLVKMNYKAISIAYNSGFNFLIMFKKNDVTEMALDDYFRSLNYDIECRKITRQQLENGNFGYGKRDLVRLIVNSLSNRIDEYKYHNVAGKLFFINKISNKEDVIEAVEISIEAGMYLKTHIKTYSKINSGKKKTGNNLVIDPLTNTLRTFLPDDKNIVCYTLKGGYRTHAYADFFDCSNINKLNMSRVGWITDFMINVKTCLGDYIKLEFLESNPVTVYNPISIDFLDLDRVIRKIFFINTTLDEQFTTLFQQAIKCFGIEIIEKTEINEDGYYIVIILEKNDFKKKKQDDIYYKYKTEKGIIVQHVTINMLQNMYKETKAKKYDDERKTRAEKEINFINALKNVITKINTEFCIKNDILNNKISFILNLDKILNKQWSFLVFENVYTKKDNKRKLTNHIYYKCTVNTNGVIKFFKFDDFTENLSRCDYFIREIVCVEKPGNGFLKSGEQYEGFMYSENGNIHRIIRTNLYSLPNGELLKENLKKSYSGNQINSVDLKKYYNSFLKDNYGIKDIDKLELNINKLNGRLSYKEILKTFSSDEKKENKLTMKSGVLKKFNRYLHNNYGIMLHSEQRDSSYDYQTENINGVKYYFSYKEEYNNHIPVGYKMDSIVYLAAGNKNKKMKLIGAPILREIIAEDKIEFTDILSMLDGSFLRGKGTYTVLPIFFKYLKEYFNMQAVEGDFEEDTTADNVAESLKMDNVQQLSLNFD